MVSSPWVPLLTAPLKPLFRAPPQLEGRAGMPEWSSHDAEDDPLARINVVLLGRPAKSMG